MLSVLRYQILAKEEGIPAHMGAGEEASQVCETAEADAAGAVGPAAVVIQTAQPYPFHPHPHSA